MTIDNQLLDALQEQAEATERRRLHLDLRNDSYEDSQRMVNVLLPGTVIPIHRHPGTTETVVALRGRVDEVFYDTEGCETGRVHLDPTAGTYAVQVPAGTYHTAVALTPCAIIEFKAGRYDPSTTEDFLLKEPPTNPTPRS